MLPTPLQTGGWGRLHTLAAPHGFPAPPHGPPCPSRTAQPVSGAVGDEEAPGPVLGTLHWEHCLNMPFGKEGCRSPAC